MLSRIKILACLMAYVFVYQNSALAVMLKDQNSSPNTQAQKALIDKDCEQLNEADGIIIKFKTITKSQFRAANFKLSTIQNPTNSSSYLLDPNKLKPLISDSFDQTLKAKTLIKNAASIKFQKKKELLSAAIEEYGLDKVFSYKPENITANTTANKCQEFKSILNELNKNPSIEYAEPNSKVKLQSLEPDQNKTQANDYFFNRQGSWGQGYDDLWGLKKIQADKAWAYSEGEGVVVAVIDTGVDYNHPDLWDNIWVNPEVVSDRNLDGKINLDDLDLNSNKNIEPEEIIPNSIGYDFAYDSSNPYDLNDHGSHIAGIIAAVKNNNIGIVGIAPKAKILAIKGLDDEGYGYPQELSQAIIYAALYADISNNSWGGVHDGGSRILLEKTFQAAYRVGMISFVASGNENINSEDDIPSKFPTVISVSASALNDEKTNFSNFGATVDIAAPGGGVNAKDTDFDSQCNLLSTTPIQSFAPFNVDDPQSNNYLHTYSRWAGTSMASPHAAGVAALIKSLHPEYDFSDIFNIITQTSDKTLVGDVYYGAGRINALNAVLVDSPPPYISIELVSTNNSVTNIPIKGIVNLAISATKSTSGKKIPEVKLEFSQDQINWTLIPFNNYKYEKYYSSFDSYGLKNGKVTFRLSIKDIEGKEFFLEKTFIIDNYNITNPLPADTLNQYDPISIRADLIGLEKTFIIEYGIGLEPTQWLNSSVVLKAFTSGSIVNNIEIAELDPKLIPIKDEIITIKIKTIFENGRTKEDKVPIFIDSQLRKGFPIYSYLYRHDPQESAKWYFETYFNQLIQTTTVNLDDDPGKEIIDIIQQKNFNAIRSNTNEEVIIAIDDDGKILWKSPAYGRISRLVTIDRDNDGKDEIFAIGTPYFRDPVQDVIAKNQTLFGLNANGTLINNSIINFNNNYASFSLIAADYNYDGTSELILIKDQTNSFIDKELSIINSKTFSVKTINNIEGCKRIRLGNFDNDKDLELVCSKYDDLFVINLNDGSIVNSWNNLKNQANSLSLTPLKGFLVSDLDNDGLDEIVTNALGYIAIFNKGNLNNYYEDSISKKDLHEYSSHYQKLAISSSDSSKKTILDINYAYSDNDSGVQSSIRIKKAFDEDRSININQLPQEADKLYYTIDRLQQTTMDIDLDGELEIFDNYGNARYNIPDQSTWTGGIFAYNADGSVIDLNPNPKFNSLLIPPENSKLTVTDFNPYRTDSTKFSVPVLTDLDGNNKLDIVVNKRSQAHYLGDLAIMRNSYRSAIYAWELPYTYNKTKDSVTEYLGNGQRTGGKTGMRPKANFTISSQDADSSESITLNASNSLGDDIVNYSWDFNSDGVFDKNSTSSVFIRKFNPGLYNITLKITNSSGESSSISKYLNVFPIQSEEATSKFIDDGMEGFSLEGSWSNSERFTAKDTIGYDMKFTAKQEQDEIKKAIWNFTNLKPGIYDIYTTWSQGTVTRRATNAPFTFFSDPANSSTVTINQELTPKGITYLSRPWQKLGAVTVLNNSITVSLSNSANDYVFADAVLVKRITKSPVANFEISSQEADNNTFVTLDASSSTGDSIISYSWDYSSDGVYDYTSTKPTLTKRFTPNLHNITLKVTNSFGESSNITKYLNVFPLQPLSDGGVFIDDGMTGFTTTGNWSNSERFVAKDTIGCDMKFINKKAANESLQKANWNFTNLQPGNYEVFVTWSQGTVTKRATNAPFKVISDSVAAKTILVNQELAPLGLTLLNRPWQKLGDFKVNNTLKVELTNNANDYVFADAVYIRPKK